MFSAAEPIANTQRVLKPVGPLFLGTNLLVTSGRTYAVYLGFNDADRLIKFVEMVMPVAGSGTQVAEVGLASTPLPPNKAGQTLTVLVADGTLDSLVAAAGTIKRNTGGFVGGAGFTVPAGLPLWALVRVALGTTQPQFSAVGGDLEQGSILRADGVGVLTAGASFASVIPIGAVTGNLAPLLIATMD